MELILHIDTAFDKGLVLLSKNGKLLSSSYCESQQEQSSWLVPAIQEMMANTEFTLKDLAAIAVVAGPGSYTGLRVGMATAKGLCYALNIPLITESSLRLLAKSAQPHLSQLRKKISGDILICAMIDARRMEVFMGIYNDKLEEMIVPGAMVLEVAFFSEKADKNHLVICGNAVPKWEEKFQHSNVSYLKEGYTPFDFVALSFEKYLQRDFTLMAYAEPVYLKEVFIHPQK